MPLFVLDTDHLSLFERGHTLIRDRVSQLTNAEISTTIITFEEQVRGRFARIKSAKNETETIDAYRWLNVTVNTLKNINILKYDERASQFYNSFRLLRLRVGTQDLRIAAITLAVGGILLTRNSRDFGQIPNLAFQDWTI